MKKLSFSKFNYKCTMISHFQVVSAMCCFSYVSEVPQQKPNNKNSRSLKGGDILDFQKGGNFEKGEIDLEKGEVTPLTNSVLPLELFFCLTCQSPLSVAVTYSCKRGNLDKIDLLPFFLVLKWKCFIVMSVFTYSKLFDQKHDLLANLMPSQT